MSDPNFWRNRKSTNSTKQPFDDYWLSSSLGRNVEQTGGVNITGDVINIGGDVVGRDKITRLSVDELPSVYKTAKVALDRGDTEKAIDNFTQISNSFPGYRDTEKLLSLAEHIVSQEIQIKFWLTVYGCLIGGIALTGMIYASTESGFIAFFAAIVGIIGGGVCAYLFLNMVFPKTMRNFWLRFGILTPTCIVGGLAGLLIILVSLIVGAIILLSQSK